MSLKVITFKRKTQNRGGIFLSFFSRVFVVFIFAVFFSLLGGRTSFAGQYHSAQFGLACAQCHVMHGTQGGGINYLSYDGAAIPPPKLLMMANAADLCLYCHENNSANLFSPTPPDVSNNTLGYVSSAGDFMHSGIDNPANKHNIGTDITLTPPPGYNGAIPWSGAGSVIESKGSIFVCTYCHAQHGTPNYRNLLYDPANSANNDATNGVIVSFEMNTGGTCSDGQLAPCDVNNIDDTTAFNAFLRPSVQFNIATNEEGNRISEWCARCHSDFYNISGGDAINFGGAALAGIGAGDDNNGTPWRRHPVADVTLVGNGHAETTNLSATSGARFADFDRPSVIDGDEQPFCLSCHYAHGGGNVGGGFVDHSMLVLTDDTGRANIDPAYVVAEGRMRNTCNSCHNQ
ncbi:MAG: hypothetical protein KAT46_05010 [Deltaproteobacteria bacterium]|nr:hypothetical protein [Deltaproteobacteria bacterium]